MNTSISDLFLPVGSAGDKGSPLRVIFVQQLGRQRKRQLPPGLHVPSLAPSNSALALNLLCPTELSPSYLEKLPLSPAQLRLELLTGRKLCSSPSSDSTSIFQCCIYICAQSEHWSGWHTPLFGASSRQLQQSVRTPSSVWLPLCLPEFLTAGPPSVSSQPSARHVNNRITAQPWKE